MVGTLAACLGRIAPFYNLALVTLVIILFLKLFKIKHNKHVFLKPWGLMFIGIIIYVVEQLVTVFDQAGVIVASKLLFPIFEFFIIITFIYMLLLQREHLGK
jgi:hypothetical protein|tara:strand:+ start:591 stop:896 length:306 start_codon:yes stop_codon:yes gene_type:complete